MKCEQPNVAVALALSALFALVVSNPCFAQTSATQAKELQLTVKEFDQNPQGGWRRLQYEAKYAEAAQLIDFFEKNKEGLSGGDRIVLCFHAAQMYAFAGDYEKALARLNNTKYPQELLAQAGPDKPVIESWNLYVEATIAFLRKNRNDLKRCLSLMEKEPEDPVLQQNIAVVRRLLKHFDESYLSAYNSKD